MQAFITRLTVPGIAAALLLPLAASAGDGHDHGDTPAAAGPALPRFAAASESFELVGVLDGRQITLYLDRSADNAPVAGARIEIELAGHKHLAQPHPQQPDAYQVMLGAAPAPGVLPVTAIVTAGQETDLLAGELDLHPHGQDDKPANQPANQRANQLASAQADAPAPDRPWAAPAGWAAGALAALLVLTGLARRLVRRLLARRRAAAGAGA